MKEIFKKTILAATIVGLSNHAVAGDVLNSPLTYSSEGLQTLAPGAEKTIESLIYELGANYIASDEITITFTPAGALAETQFEGTVVADGDEKGNSITFSLLDQTADSATYRVTAVTDNYDTTETVVDFGAALLNVSSILAGNVSVTYSSIKAGSDDTFDNGSEGSNTGVLADSESQITALTVTNEFDAVIDVNTGRTMFTEESEGHDSMSFTIGNNTDLEDPAYIHVSAVVFFPFDASGEDLSFESENGEVYSENGEVFYDDGDGDGDGDGIVAFLYDGAVTTDTITIINGGFDAKIAQEFKVTAGYGVFASNYELLNFFAGEDVPAGEWTLNGNVVNIPYMPFAPGISQILYVTNSGDFDGGVYVTAHDEDGIYYDLGMVATAGKNSVTKITGQVQLALAAQGFTKGKLSIDVTVNAPDGDITVQAAYNIGSDRGFVITDQYKKSDMYEMIP
jgi:hypothetical protein